MTKVPITGLASAIEETLTIYHQDVVAALDQSANKAVKDLAKQTKATAPTGKRGDFKRSISSKLLEKSNRGCTYVWYVKPPNHRLTHLLVHGHAKKDGGRTKANPFLQNALTGVLTDYQKEVEEAIRNG